MDQNTLYASFIKKKKTTIPLTMIFDWWLLVFSAVLLRRSIAIDFVWELPPVLYMIIYVHMSENKNAWIYHKMEQPFKSADG